MARVYSRLQDSRCSDAKGLPNGASRDLINKRDARNKQPRGAPVDIEEDKDGALLISEDRNGTILKLV